MAMFSNIFWTTKWEVVHVPKIMTASRVQHQHVEELVEVPVHMTQDDEKSRPQKPLQTW